MEVDVDVGEEEELEEDEEDEDDDDDEDDAEELLRLDHTLTVWCFPANERMRSPR